MSGVLFVSNGHGEDAIAAAIAHHVRALRFARTDHFPLVGDPPALVDFPAVGPRRRMPSGGLIAMFNVRNILADMRAGLAGLTAAQLAFLRGARRRYDVAVAVGDAFCLAMALLSGLPVVFVGTAKSVLVAGYGAAERALLRRAHAVFVRDGATADWLRARRVDAHAPGNVIVDLLGTGADAPALGAHGIVLLPGSRSAAYRDAVKLAAVVRAIGQTLDDTRAIIAIAPTLDPGQLAQRLREGGWDVRAGAGERVFRAHDGERALITGWTGSLGSALRAATLAIGQAGTANEAAAALGLPVIALQSAGAAGSSWYRRRQIGLLGEALMILDDDPVQAAAHVVDLWNDPQRLGAMREAGPKRLGVAGGARAIAQAIAAQLAQAVPA